MPYKKKAIRSNKKNVIYDLMTELGKIRKPNFLARPYFRYNRNGLIVYTKKTG
mgnify:CR=1 FL=1